MKWRAMSVRLSVACLDLTGERKGLGSPNWHDGIRVLIREPI